MAIKKSVRLTDETIKALQAITQDASAVNWSGSINSMAEQFDILIEQSLPSLTQNQSTSFACIYNGYAPSDSIQQEIRLLAWHISEGYQYDEQVRDLIGTEEEAVAFIEQVKSWNDAEKLAVIYKARRFWSDSKPVVGDE